MDNWYRIRRAHDIYTAQDVGRLVLLDDDARTRGLCGQGFLEAVDSGVDAAVVASDVGTADAFVTPKRGRRGKQDQDRPAEESPVGKVSGDELRGDDLPPD